MTTDDKLAYVEAQVTTLESYVARLETALDHRQRALAIALRRMDGLYAAIGQRDWEQTEFCFDQVMSTLTKLAGTRERGTTDGNG